MAVEVLLPNRDSSKFIEGPPGYFSGPDDLVENPPGSGLYEVPNYLVETSPGSGVYVIPSGYIGAGSYPISNLKNFSVQEDATSIEPSSSFGGVGRISFGMNESADTPLMIGEVTLVDGSRGKTSGTIVSVASNDGDVSVAADSVLGLFNTERTVQPFVGTFGNAIRNYCNLVGITNEIVVDDSLENRNVVYPGWFGNIWVHIKEILVREQAEMALVFNRLHVRPLRTLVATLDRATSLGWEIDNGGASRNIEINYYNNTYGTQREIYPLTTEDPAIYSINAEEEQVVSVRLNASVFTLNQPTAVNFVENRSYAGTNGVYAVTGQDNLPVNASQWLAQGGSVRVRKTEDPSIIEIVIKGARDPAGNLAPYRIAMSSGAGNDYNSLHITATAVTWQQQTLRLPTGASNVTTSDEVGVTIDNPFISTKSEAISLGLKAAMVHAGLSYSLSGNALDVNRSDSGRDLIQATVADFNAAVPSGTTIADFNVERSGQTIADFNANWQARVDDLFENQLFGNAIGSRVLRPDANFRIVSTTTTDSTMQFSAELDTLIEDFNIKWPATTYSWEGTAHGSISDAVWSGKPIRRNLVINPSVETNSLGWVNFDGPDGESALSRLTPSESSDYFLRCSWSVGTSVPGGGVLYGTLHVEPGETYAGSILVRASKVQPVALSIEWLDSDGFYIDTSSGDTVTLNNANEWQTVSINNSVAPVGAELARVTMYVVPGSGAVNWEEDDYMDVDDLIIEHAAVSTGYFDGDSSPEGPTIADFNAQFSGYTCKDFSIVPLRRDSDD